MIVAMTAALVLGSGVALANTVPRRPRQRRDRRLPLLSLKTVQNHVSNIFRKLQVADRVQAALRAREAGLGG
jgi:hypothetical protein